MGDLFSLLILSAFSLNTNNNGYNYVGNFQDTCNITFVNFINDDAENVNISGVLTFNGDIYVNNSENFQTVFNSFTIDIFYNGDISGNTYPISSLTYNTPFSQNNGPFLRIDTLSILAGNGVVMLTVVDYGQSPLVSYTLSDSLNDDWFVDFVYDESIEGLTVYNSYSYNYANNSLSVDHLKDLINQRLVEYDGGINSYDVGYQTGYNDGYVDGVIYGDEGGYNRGYSTGFNSGYNTGFNAGFNADSTALTIFSGIIAIGMIPVNFFLAIFNFEILGINLASFVSSLLSVACVIIVVKHVLAIKDD